MTSLEDFKEWLDQVVEEHPYGGIAVHDGGLAVVISDAEGSVTEHYYEIGGIPLEGDED